MFATLLIGALSVALVVFGFTVPGFAQVFDEPITHRWRPDIEKYSRQCKLSPGASACCNGLRGERGRVQLDWSWQA
jgi:hypothetical protein